ncbi:hemin uptake protein HemP [Roseicella frigidaeris]|uniref:Hemin uptake protein HemP n=1 Tax=Roseicella frigidaeris TaxID=2230885 RepID=A0A327MDH8_9PROT|nr:hemin uptake protein HemP [Roseicella frigidaeris]RAI60727.1 hemin uptake protein HemP [Roseicella frigidaeris]
MSGRIPEFAPRRAPVPGAEQAVARPPRWAASGPAVAQAPAVRSADLLGGGRELVIWHGSEAYLLRLTANNKLLLTK